MGHVARSIYLERKGGDAKYTTADFRYRTLSGALANVLRPVTYFRDPITDEIVEQDFAPGVQLGEKGQLLVDYTDGLVPWMDLRGAIGFGWGITPFILGLISGWEEKDSIEDDMQKI